MAPRVLPTFLEGNRADSHYGLRRLNSSSESPLESISFAGSTRAALFCYQRAGRTTSDSCKERAAGVAATCSLPRSRGQAAPAPTPAPPPLGTIHHRYFTGRE